MNAQRFDALARSLGATTSRRSLLKQAGVALVGAMAASVLPRAAQAEPPCTPDMPGCTPSTQPPAGGFSDRPGGNSGVPRTGGFSDRPGDGTTGGSQASGTGFSDRPGGEGTGQPSGGFSDRPGGGLPPCSPNGSPCDVAGVVCCSGYCAQGVCGAPPPTCRPVGASCLAAGGVDDAVCCSGNCCAGYCTSQYTPRNFGPPCCIGTGDACQLSEQCCSGACVAGTCAGCSGSGQPCFRPDLTCCDGLCVNLGSNYGNCGACGYRCPTCPGGPDKENQLDCLGGKCVGTRGFGQQLSDCNGVCADLLTNVHNCGACGVDCGAGTCQNGQCVCADAQHACGKGCCDPDQACCNHGCCAHGVSTCGPDGGCGCSPQQPCASGCCASGQCLSPSQQQTNGVCGPTGGTCTACTIAGTSCAGSGQYAGQCVCANGQPPVGGSCGCSAQHPCIAGCCDGSGTCQPGTTAAACGPVGGPCTICSTAGTTCATSGAHTGQCVCTSTQQPPVNGSCCPQGQTACGSTCCQPSQCCSGGSCVSSCPNGECCVDGTCQTCTGCSAQTPCTIPGTVCAFGGPYAGQCICSDTQKPPANGHCPCALASCETGCCDAGGVCRQPQPPNYCGRGGVACPSCPTGETLCCHVPGGGLGGEPVATCCAAGTSCCINPTSGVGLCCPAGWSCCAPWAGAPGAFDPGSAFCCAPPNYCAGTAAKMNAECIGA